MILFSLFLNTRETQLKCQRGCEIPPSPQKKLKKKRNKKKKQKSKKKKKDLPTRPYSKEWNSLNFINVQNRSSDQHMT